MTGRPQRITLQRTKGFRLQAASRAMNGLEAVKVDRSGPWGNPFTIGRAFTFAAVGLGYRGDDQGMRLASVALFRAWLTGEPVALGPEHVDSHGAVQFAGESEPTPVGDCVRMAGLRLGASRLYAPAERPDLTPLIGKNLACWCKRGTACHGDVILNVLREREDCNDTEGKVRGRLQSGRSNRSRTRRLGRADRSSV